MASSRSLSSARQSAQPGRLKREKFPMGSVRGGLCRKPFPPRVRFPQAHAGYFAGIARPLPPLMFLHVSRSAFPRQLIAGLCALAMAAVACAGEEEKTSRPGVLHLSLDSAIRMALARNYS